MDEEDNNRVAERGAERMNPVRNRVANEEEMNDEAPNYLAIAGILDEPNDNIADDMNEPIDEEIALAVDMIEPADNNDAMLEIINDQLEHENMDETADHRDNAEEDESDEEEQQFDITLAASHSYMGSALSDVSGRAFLEPGWTGRIPVLAHHGTVFPGEIVPMLLTNQHDAALIADTLNDKEHKLFGLLCPDETCQVVSGYGVACEVFEAALGPGSPPASATFKARAVHRFRLKDMPKRALPVALYVRVRSVEVRVLPDVHSPHPLRHARLAALDNWRRNTDQQQQDSMLQRLDAAATPWPHFVYQIFDFARMRALIRDYFHTLGLEKMLPEDPVSLSFWVASNLTVSGRDRLALFVVDNALLRLHMECRFITRKSVLCCSSCATEIARREHVFAMSSHGVHSNYTNPGGYMHDIVTVTTARNTEASGAPSAEYSWFPGYAWAIVLCVCCMAHVGWRFTALRRNLRPQQFYGLCRNYVQPRDAPHSPPPPPPPPAH